MAFPPRYFRQRAGIHFIHVGPKAQNGLPVIITHGWTGSIIEQMKIIGPLTDPTAYGGRAEESFDAVLPSLPGFAVEIS